MSCRGIYVLPQMGLGSLAPSLLSIHQAVKGYDTPVRTYATLRCPPSVGISHVQHRQLHKEVRTAIGCSQRSPMDLPRLTPLKCHKASRTTDVAEWIRVRFVP